MQDIFFTNLGGHVLQSYNAGLGTFILALKTAALSATIIQLKYAIE